MAIPIPTEMEPVPVRSADLSVRPGIAATGHSEIRDGHRYRFHLQIPIPFGIGILRSKNPIAFI
jgi:hypothetical protein